jgi:hypothetical protein
VVGDSLQRDRDTMITAVQLAIIVPVTIMVMPIMARTRR